VKRKDGKGPPPAPAYYLAESASGEDLEWLQRRRGLLVRSIAEMEHHQRTPNLSPEMVPDVADLLDWAILDLARVDAAIAGPPEPETLPSAATPDSAPPSRVRRDSRRGRHERA
jgi:hypothetical protein